MKHDGKDYEKKSPLAQTMRRKVLRNPELLTESCRLMAERPNVILPLM